MLEFFLILNYLIKTFKHLSQKNLNFHTPQPENENPHTPQTENPNFETPEPVNKHATANQPEYSFTDSDTTTPIPGIT